MKIKLQELLDKKGLTQKELAYSLRVSQTIVSLWCKNKIVPSNRHLTEIAEFLGVDYKKLLK